MDRGWKWIVSGANKRAGSCKARSFWVDQPMRKGAKGISWLKVADLKLCSGVFGGHL